MLRKIGSGKLKYRDQEKNVIIGVFENKNVKGSVYGTISITALKGAYKESMELSIPDLKRLLVLFERMPPIKQHKKIELMEGEEE